MSDFPLGITAPEGAQKLVDVCKETWAVTQDESSDVNTNDEAVGRYEIAVDELNELGVHVNLTKGISLCLPWVLKRPRAILLRLLLEYHF